MRWYSIAIALSLAACNKPASSGGEQSGSAAAGSAAPTEARPAPKKPVDTKPLPPLAKDPGGATGKPQRGVGLGGLGTDAGRDIALSAAGDAYVVGYFGGEATFGAAGKRAATEPEKPGAAAKKEPPSDAFLVRIDAEGKVAWARTFGGELDDSANGVAVRGDRIVAVGAFAGEMKVGELTKKAMGSDDLFIAAFDTDGNPQWVWHAGGKDSDGANTAAATPDGGWVVAGSFSSTGHFGTVELKSKGGTDALLIKLGATGELEWVKSFGGRYHDRIRHVGVDGQGNIFVQGEFKDSADWGGPKPLIAAGGSDFDVVLAKYDLNGDHKWSQRFGSQLDEMAGGLAVDPAGNVTMTGAFRGQISFGEGDDHTSNGEEDIFVARFDGEGKLAWARTYGAERDDAGSGIASDAAGNTVLTGWFQSSVDFGLGAVKSKNYNKDVFALKLDAQGALTWAQVWGDKDHDQGRALAIDAQGAAHAVGLFRFQLDLVTPPLESVRAEGDRAPKADTFVVKLAR